MEEARPRALHLVDAPPLTGVGKVNVRRLCALALRPDDPAGP